MFHVEQLLISPVAQWVEQAPYKRLNCVQFAAGLPYGGGVQMVVKKTTKTRKSNTARSYAGKVARDNGAAFEELISYICGTYRQKGVADIEKTPEPTRVIKKYGLNKFICCFTKQAQPDYKGVLKGGRMIAFEAKNIEDRRIAHNRITQEQAECFNSYEKLGALCFVLISYKLERFYAVPWSEFREHEKTTGKKSFNLEDLARYEVININMFLTPIVAKIAIKTAQETGQGAAANFVEQDDTEPADYCTVCEYGGTAETRQGYIKYCRACEPARAVTGKVHRGQCPNFIRK